MKKLLLLAISCAMGAGLFAAADGDKDKKDVAAPTTGFWKKPAVQLGLWAGGAALAYEAVNYSTNLGHNIFDKAFAIAQVKGVLYKLQQMVPGWATQNPRAASLLVAATLSLGTHYGLGWPKGTVGMAVEGALAYALAHYFLTHTMDAPADASVDAAATA